MFLGTDTRNTRAVQRRYMKTSPCYPQNLWPTLLKQYSCLMIQELFLKSWSVCLQLSFLKYSNLFVLKISQKNKSTVLMYDPSHILKLDLWLEEEEEEKNSQKELHFRNIKHLNMMPIDTSLLQNNPVCQP